MISYMNKIIKILLCPSPTQFTSLLELQKVFADACNSLTPEVKRNRIWNRVVLHHLYYKSLRVQYPNLGAQMVCNVIYAVSRMSRLIYQSELSPFNLNKLGDRPLPMLRFADNCPVYFDRHTLSLTHEKLSLFAMDGRLSFENALSKQNIVLLQTSKIKEINLRRDEKSIFGLIFCLELSQNEKKVVDTEIKSSVFMTHETSQSLIPDYVSLEVVE